MEILFAPILFFLICPEGIALVASLFFFASLWKLSAQRSAWPTFIAGIGWIVFAMWELHCRKQGYNIRLDFILIVPVLFVLTGWGLQSVFQRRNTEIVGLGVLLDADEKTGTVLITSVFPKSPAAQAGLSERLLIGKINDVSAEGKSLQEYIDMMAGPVGTKVRLEVVNSESNETKTVELTKQKFLT